MKKFLIKKIRCLPQFKEFAQKSIFKKTWNWLENGSEWGNTANLNLKDLRKIKIIPKIFSYNSKSFAANSLFGTKMPLPLIIAPMGHLTQFHKDGEAELALGAQKSSTFITISGALSRLKLSDIKKKAKYSKILYQIYFFTFHIVNIF